ncbi:MAG: GNAT family N-acetyltransferase [Actinomycetales bacterium]|nr:GNAT family N-acetyltransferase [Actinomycetales bacterium]
MSETGSRVAADALEIVPAESVDDATLIAAFGTAGDPVTCYCQYFKRRGAAWTQGRPEEFRADLCADAERARVASVPGPGLVALRDGDPVGWVAVEPRTSYARLLASAVGKASREAADDASVWAVTCFVIPREHRRQGLATALLEAAISHARSRGARVLEGYPVDTRGGRVPSANLYHGPLSVFERLGFVEVARPNEDRAVVALEL